MFLDLQLKRTLFLSHYNQTKISRQILVKSCNKFYENPSERSRIIHWGQKDMTKLLVDFHKFSNVRQSGRAWGISIYVHLGLKSDGLWNLRMRGQ